MLTPRKALKKAFLKIKPHRDEIEDFKTNLLQLIDRSNETESEEFHKNLVQDFLKKIYYDPDHFINTKDRKDLVIHKGKTADTPVAVIIEAKRPTNKHEMPGKDDLNVKGFHELLLYYLDERVTLKNEHITHLIINNINEWFIFDSHVFDKLFYQNKLLLALYKDYKIDSLSGKGTDYFYNK
ncbi:MAG: type II restriction endonuclease, partial [Candidatus Marinimicrobia bacterium]|nr:type II restriction endonuclease [Candidatus Neomarinimicrobiota bacterium]